MTAKEIYESLDLTQLPDAFVEKVKKVEQATKGFTIQSEKVDAFMKGAYDKIKKDKPTALKNLKVEEKVVKKEIKTAKATKIVEDLEYKIRGKKSVTKKTPTPSAPKRKENTNAEAKRTKKKGETFKDAVARVQKEREAAAKEAEKVVSKTAQALKNLEDLLANDPKLAGYPRTYGRQSKNIDASKDSKIKARPAGKRVSKKGHKNQYGPSKGGRVYWENRDNRSDRFAPDFPDKIYLEMGGETDDLGFPTGHTYLVIEVSPSGDKKLIKSTKDYMTALMSSAVTRGRKTNKDNRVVIVDKEDKKVIHEAFEAGGEITITPTQLINNPDALVGTTTMTELFEAGGVTAYQEDEKLSFDKWTNLVADEIVRLVRSNKFNDLVFGKRKDFGLDNATYYINAYPHYDGILELYSNRVVPEDVAVLLMEKYRDRSEVINDADIEMLVEMKPKSKNNFEAGGEVFVTPSSLINAGSGDYVAGSNTMSNMFEDGGDVNYSQDDMYDILSEAYLMAEDLKDESTAAYIQKILDRMDDGDTLPQYDFRDILEEIYYTASKNNGDENDLTNYVEKFEAGGKFDKDGYVTPESLINSYRRMNMSDEEILDYAKYFVEIQKIQREESDNAGFKELTIRKARPYEGIIEILSTNTMAKGGFIAIYNGKRVEIEAETLLDAKKKAIQELKVPKSKQGLLSVMSNASMANEDFRFMESGGKLPKTIKYYGVNEVKEYRLKNGDKIDPSKTFVDSGVYVSATKTMKPKEEEFQQKLELKKGGATNWKGEKINWKEDYIYIPRYDIEEVELDNGKVIKGDYVVSGLYLPKSDRTKQLEKEMKARMKKMAKGGYVVVGDKDGFWTITSTPSSEKKAKELLESTTFPRGEKGKIVSVAEAMSHKKVIGKEYLESGGTIVAADPSAAMEDLNQTYGYESVYAKGGNLKRFDDKIADLSDDLENTKDTIGETQEFLRDIYGKEMTYQDRLDNRFEKGGVVHLYFGGEQPDEVMEAANENEAASIAMKMGAEHYDFVAQMEKGGRLGFEGLAKKVAKRYEGKPVKAKYQKEYGKTYSKEEAMEVGRKVAAKVYGQQQAKMEMGGQITQPYSLINAGSADYVAGSNTMSNMFAKGGEVLEDIIVSTKNFGVEDVFERLGLDYNFEGTNQEGLDEYIVYEVSQDNLDKIKTSPVQWRYAYAKGGSLDSKVSDKMAEMAFGSEAYNAILMGLQQSMKGGRALSSVQAKKLADEFASMAVAEKTAKFRDFNSFPVSFTEAEFAKGGSLDSHGLKDGDVIMNTSEEFIKVLDKDGVPFFVNLANGYRGKEKSLPFAEGGKLKSVNIPEIAKKFGKSTSEVFEQIQVGEKHEMEHTQDPKKARKIALDHLSDDMDYYKKLKKLGL